MGFRFLVGGSPSPFKGEGNKRKAIDSTMIRELTF